MTKPNNHGSTLTQLTITKSHIDYHANSNDYKESVDRFMSLSYEVLSPSTVELVDFLSVSIASVNAETKRITKKFRQAVAAVVADLLSAASVPNDLYLYRPRAVADFTGQRVGYRPCIAALDGMMDLDLLHHEPGVWLGSQRKGEGETARYRAKSGLLELALRYGITPGNWRSHFTPAPRPSRMAHPIIVRGKREFWDREDKGKSLPLIKTHPGYIAAVGQVDRINAYWALQSLTGSNHDGFVRIFNHGDQNGFAYNMGGRLYSKSSGDSYQNMNKNYRPRMRINGEPVVELDLRASFLTILYALHGSEIGSDPYTFCDLPREVVKTWINMTLGYDRFHSQWPADTVAEIKEEKSIDLYRDYPIESVRAAVIEEHPILASWPSSRYRWQHLQYIESSAIIDAVEVLCLHHDVAALPLHDALLVPSSKVPIAMTVLRDTFRARVGVDPTLTIKDSWTPAAR